MHRNNSCKSFNVLPGTDITKRVCELNNTTRVMKPRDFIKRKGSSYYGHARSVPPSEKENAFMLLSKVFKAS